MPTAMHMAANNATMEAAVKRSRKLLNKRALVAAAASAMPVPGLDWAVDAAMLSKLIPEINKEFGLTPAQLDQLDPKKRDQVQKAVALVGSVLIGKFISKDLVIKAATKIGVRLSTKQLAKYVPGQLEPDSKAAAAPERREFVQKMWPLAVEAGKRLGVDPRHVVAQAALESGWGQAAPGNNFFGIKAGSGWRGAALENQTQEFVNGAAATVAVPFRAYRDVAASVTDYAGLLGGDVRYAAVRGTGSDTTAFTQALQNAGYATDPDYAVKLRAVVQAVDAALPKTIKGGQEWPITPSTGSL